MIKIPSELRYSLRQLGRQAATAGAKAARFLFALTCACLVVWAAVAPFDVDPRDTRFEMLLGLEVAARALFGASGLVGLWLVGADRAEATSQDGSGQSET